MRNYTKIFKPAEELVFSDDFMFCEIMKDPHICKSVLETLLQIKIDHVEFPILQKTITPYYNQKGVRFDVYVANSDKVFDIECQAYSQKDLGLRTRYYQSMLDSDTLAKGCSMSSSNTFVIPKQFRHSEKVLSLRAKRSNP